MGIKGDVGVYLAGAQVLIKEAGFFITPPTVKQIIQYGEQEFFLAAKLLSDLSALLADVRQGESELDELGDFQIFMELINDPSAADMRRSVQLFISFCCPDFEVEVAKRTIDFYVEQDGERIKRGQLTPFTFDVFSSAIGELFLPKQKSEDIDYNIDESNPESVRLLEKIKRNREKLRKAKEGESGEYTSVFALQLSVLSIGQKLPLDSFLSYTPFQLYDAFDRFMLKTSADAYQEMCLVPFSDPSKLDKPESWFVDLYDKKRIEQMGQNTNTISNFNKTVSS